jgi:hypothetical protein
VFIASLHSSLMYIGRLRQKLEIEAESENLNQRKEWFLSPSFLSDACFIA